MDIETMHVKSVQWEELPSDLLNEIGKFIYCYDDYLQLLGVCKQWNMALPRIPRHRRNPWMVLPFDDQTLETHLAEKKIYYMRLPELKNSKLRGSCHGWLISVEIDGTIRMLNPFTKKIRLDLPPLSTFPGVDAYDPEQEQYTLKDIDDGVIYNIDSNHAQKSLTIKIILSSSPDEDYMALTIYGPSYFRLAFCRRGDKKWTDIPKSVTESDIQCDYGYQDAIFHEGNIYVIDFYARMFEFDMKTTPIPLRVISEVPPPHDLSIVYLNDRIEYLVGCPDGGILMVVRDINEYVRWNIGQVDSQCFYNTSGFHIYKLNKGAKQWSRVYNLKNCVLLIGLNSSTWMSAYTFPESRGNCIYYTDNLLEPQFSGHVGGHDAGVLNLESGNMCQLFQDSVLLSPPPTWKHLLQATILVVGSARLVKLLKFPSRCFKRSSVDKNYGPRRFGTSRIREPSPTVV